MVEEVEAEVADMSVEVSAKQVNVRRPRDISQLAPGVAEPAVRGMKNQV